MTRHTRFQPSKRSKGGQRCYGYGAEFGLQASLQHPRAGMCSPPDSVAVLQQLLRLVGAKKVIEVGVFTGEMVIIADSCGFYQTGLASWRVQCLRCPYSFHEYTVCIGLSSGQWASKPEYDRKIV